MDYPKLKTNLKYVIFYEVNPPKMVLDDNQHILIFNIMIVYIFHYFLVFMPMHTYPLH